MSIKQHLSFKPSLLKDHVSKYAFLGLAISLASIVVASILVSYQLTGFIDFPGIILAHKSNPALWALDLTPFMFAYWGQSFCYEVANTMESMIESKTKELASKSSDLEFKLQYETQHDHLTNLPNQRLLVLRINQGIKHLNKTEQLALILLHINSFQEINYKFGSFNGNNLLVQYAEKLKTVLLEPSLLQAYMGMNMAARLQGAEFAILLPRLRKEHHLENIVKKIVEATSSNFMLDGNPIKITTTAGVAVYPAQGESEETLLKHASASLFLSEKNHKPYLIYHPGLEKAKPQANIKVKDLSKAINNGEIEILFQPIYDLQTQKLVATEALSYVNDPEQGKLNAEKLIPFAEGSDIVKQVTNLSIERILKQLSEWHHQGKDLSVMINIFDANDLGLPFFIDGLLQRYDISPDHLKILLTEKTCLSDQNKSINLLNQLTELGIKTVISDFGSGYSSFNYLATFPINGVRIDKSFIINMMNNEKKQNLVKGAIKLISSMNLEIYAEGISDETMMKKLKEFGCTYGEGWNFTVPISASEISKLD